MTSYVQGYNSGDDTLLITPHAKGKKAVRCLDCHKQTPKEDLTKAFYWLAGNYEDLHYVPCAWQYQSQRDTYILRKMSHSCCLPGKTGGFPDGLEIKESEYCGVNCLQAAAPTSLSAQDAIRPRNV